MKYLDWRRDLDESLILYFVPTVTAYILVLFEIDTYNISNVTNNWQSFRFGRFEK